MSTRHDAVELTGAAVKLWMLEALDELDQPKGQVVVDDRPGGLAVVTDRPPTKAPFDEARALIAIACADGPPSEAEEYAVRRHIAVDADGVWRVFRPSEVGMPASALDARRTLERMVAIALVDRSDGVVDASERAVLPSQTERQACL